MSLTSGDLRQPVHHGLQWKRVLNAGSGPLGSKQLHAMFEPRSWRETRLDIDPGTKPDILGSFTDLRGSIEDNVFDAIWSSHAMEHLHSHEVAGTLAEFRRVLKPTGFALIRCPDLEIVASLVVRHGPDHVAYMSPIGPVTPLDMLFGHSSSIAKGRGSMAHHTGFTAQSMARLCLSAGFSTVMTKTEYFDLWTVALLEHTDKNELLQALARAGLTMDDSQEETTA